MYDLYFDNLVKNNDVYLLKIEINLKINETCIYNSYNRPWFCLEGNWLLNTLKKLKLFIFTNGFQYPENIWCPFQTSKKDEDEKSLWNRT